MSNRNTSENTSTETTATSKEERIHCQFCFVQMFKIQYYDHILICQEIKDFVTIKKEINPCKMIKLEVKRLTDEDIQKINVELKRKDNKFKK